MTEFKGSFRNNAEKAAAERAAQIVLDHQYEPKFADDLPNPLDPVSHEAVVAAALGVMDQQKKEYLKGRLVDLADTSARSGAVSHSEIYELTNVPEDIAQMPEIKDRINFEEIISTLAGPEEKGIMAIAKKFFGMSFREKVKRSLKDDLEEKEISYGDENVFRNWMERHNSILNNRVEENRDKYASDWNENLANISNLMRNTSFDIYWDSEKGTPIYSISESDNSGRLKSQVQVTHVTYSTPHPSGKEFYAIRMTASQGNSTLIKNDSRFRHTGMQVFMQKAGPLLDFAIKK